MGKATLAKQRAIGLVGQARTKQNLLETSDVARLSERFWTKVDRSGGCWVWIASLKKCGYGQFEINNKPRLAHRVAYELLIGPIPEGMTLDHLCRNRACVNPAHLEPVTSRENLLRGTGWSGRNSRKTYCPQGHPYDAQNTGRHRNGHRFCRVCKRAHDRRYRRSKREHVNG